MTKKQIAEMKKVSTAKWQSETTPEQRVSALNEHSMGDSFEVGEKVFCLHCDSSFNAEDIALDPYLTDFYSKPQPKLYFECPNDCDGSPLDFASSPWWRG